MTGPTYTTATTTTTTITPAAASFVSTGKSNGRCRGTQLFEVWPVPLAQCAAKCAETPSCRYFGSWSAGYNGAGKDGCRGWDACEGSLEPLWSGYYNRIYRMTGPIMTGPIYTTATTTTTTITPAAPDAHAQADT